MSPLRLLLALIITLPGLASGQPVDFARLREAYTHAFQLKETISSSDLRHVLEFEQSVVDWNRTTTLLYKDLVDDSVSAESWLANYEPRMVGVRAAVGRGTNALSRIINPAVKSALTPIHEGNLTMLIGYSGCADGIRSGDETVFHEGISRIQAGSSRKRTAGLILIRRLEEKLGREVMERSFQTAVREVLRELEKAPTR
jgi:hypothetical protein